MENNLDPSNIGFQLTIELLFAPILLVLTNKLIYKGIRTLVMIIRL